MLSLIRSCKWRLNTLCKSPRTSSPSPLQTAIHDFAITAWARISDEEPESGALWKANQTRTIYTFFISKGQATFKAVSASAGVAFQGASAIQTSYLSLSRHSLVHSLMMERESPSLQHLSALYVSAKVRKSTVILQARSHFHKRARAAEL